MSISPVGNSDAYARYRQQALDLLASPAQSTTTAPQASGPSYVAPPDATDESASNPFATKFKTDLSTLNSAHDSKPHTHGAHAHHAKADATAASAAESTTDAPSATDAIGQTLDEFANLLKTAAGIAAVIA